jgi:hypothetical protein
MESVNGDLSFLRSYLPLTGVEVEGLQGPVLLDPGSRGYRGKELSLYGFPPHGCERMALILWRVFSFRGILAG